MEEELMSSIVSNPKVKVIINEESSDFNSNSYLTLACKRSRIDQDQHIASNWTKFKGVVPQHNGHWGAQIYANHQRVWLGTFKSEKEAAMAYDSAALKLRSRDIHRNFPYTDNTFHEPLFQSSFSTQEILNMIKDGSYPTNFDEFLKNQCGGKEIGLNLATTTVHGNGWYSCTLLFQKELTPSDVGKLNRLVIPKKYAVKYFPNVIEGNEENANMQLGFHDRHMKLWKFRYCYWKSSQSYVFTRGWNKFVKEKDLKVNDTLGFYVYKNGEGTKGGQNYWIVEVDYKDDTSNGGTVLREVDQCIDELGQQHGQFETVKEERKVFDDQKPMVGLDSPSNLEKKGSLRLFGVQIDI